MSTTNSAGWDAGTSMHPAIGDEDPPECTPTKERSLPFSAQMALATLREVDPKTMTRRPVKNLSRAYPDIVYARDTDPDAGWWPYLSDDGESLVCSDGNERPMDCPYGKPCDWLWGREHYRLLPEHDSYSPKAVFEGAMVRYEADGLMRIGYRHDLDATTRPIAHEGFGRFRPGMFMCRWMSRIELEVTHVRVERLQDISEADAIAEGIQRWPLGFRVATSGAPTHECRTFDTAIGAFRWLWESINGAGSWDANPWVWVIGFKRIDQ